MISSNPSGGSSASGAQRDTRLWLAFMAVIAGGIGLVVCTLMHRSIEEAYATTLSNGIETTATVDTILQTRQGTRVGLLLGRTKHTVTIASGKENLEVEMVVRVFRSNDERAPVAIEGTTPSTWWGNTSRVCGAFGGLAAVAALFFWMTGSRHRGGSTGSP